MGDDAIRPVPARSGCLKWTCGCVVAAAVLSLVALVAGWYALSGWTPAESAWERLPPDTAFALEVHDAKSLLDAASADPGAVSLAGAVLRAYQTFLEAHNIPVESNLPQSAYEYIRGFSWLYTTFFPNYFLFGMRAGDARDGFFIAQPPRWFAWTVGAGMADGVVAEMSGHGGAAVYLAFKGDHIVAGLTRDSVRHVVDHWDAKPAPFGKGAGRNTPYAMAAVNTANAGQGAELSEDGAGAPFLSGGPAGNLALQDPFAAPPGAEARLPAHAALRYQALATADESGWRIAFEAVDAAKPFPPAGFAEHIDTGFGAENPEVVLPDASDVELALRLPETAMEAIREGVTDAVPPRFGGDWLRNGWLDRAGGMFTLLASRPVNANDAAADSADAENDAPPPYPPLPVLSLGWNLRSLHAPVPFANYLGEWLDKLGAPGDPLPQSMAKALLSYEVAADELSGAVSVPPILLNGARPAWKFMTETVPSMGWMATDPSGLPEPSLLPRLAAPLLPEPAVDRAIVVTNWDMSRAFIDALEAIATDRLRQLPDKWFADIPLDKKDFADTLHTVGQLFTAYPRGVVKADINTGTGEAMGKAFIPFGMSVDIE